MTKSGITILNVDDSEVGLCVKSRILRQAGYAVIEAKMGRQALRLVSEAKPQLVLLDVKLLDVSGFEVCRRIKTDPATAATLVLQTSSLFVNGSDKVRALEGGADGYLTEPVAPDELLANVKALLRLCEAERARSLESEKTAREAAEAATRAKDEFLALISHELRTPLNAVLGWARFLRQQRREEGTVARALDVIERNAATQLQLIEDLLDVSRIITGKLRLEVMPVKPALLVETACDRLRPAAEAKGIMLNLVIDGRDGIIKGDPERLQQIVWNLLSNAIKFTPEGGRIELRLDWGDRDVRITVSDTGKGVSQEFLPYVFDRFLQVERAAPQQGGLGLGLALVRSLAELHGGRVSVSSQGEGLGATFTVVLPQLGMVAPPSGLRSANSALGAHASCVPASEAGQSAVRGLQSSILKGLWLVVVIDEAEVCDSLKAILEPHGVRVECATSAAEALAVFTTACPDGAAGGGRSPDMLVSDICLPNKDAYLLLKRLRMLPPERGGQVPVVALVPKGRAEDRLRALTAGFHNLVPMPVDPEELMTVVVNLTGRIAGAQHA